jgi:hypothetical protein
MLTRAERNMCVCVWNVNRPIPLVQHFATTTSCFCEGLLGNKYCYCFDSPFLPWHRHVTWPRARGLQRLQWLTAANLGPSHQSRVVSSLQSAGSRERTEKSTVNPIPSSCETSPWTRTRPDPPKRPRTRGHVEPWRRSTLSRRSRHSPAPLPRSLAELHPRLLVICSPHQALLSYYWYARAWLLPSTIS